MNVRAITLLSCLAWATTAVAEAPKAQLSEIRAQVHELEGATSKLGDLMTQYRSLVEQRPQKQGGSPEANKAYEEQLAKWTRAVDRLMRRIDKAHATLVEKSKNLDGPSKTNLPTNLAKDVANAHNEAEAERVAAEQALKNKPAQAHAAKREKKKAPSAKESEPPPLGDIDDL